MTVHFAHLQYLKLYSNLKTMTGTNVDILIATFMMVVKVFLTTLKQLLCGFADKKLVKLQKNSIYRQYKKVLILHITSVSENYLV